MAQKTAPKRVTLTKSQAASAAGAQLLSLLVDLTADGELSLGELDKLRIWLDDNLITDVPAVAWLREIVADVLSDGRVTNDERIELILAIERVMPKDQRLVAAAHRKAADQLMAKDEEDDEFNDHDGNSDYRSASDPQCRYILALGGNVTPGLSVSAARELIDSLLASSSSVSNRQMMVLRFWNRVEVSRDGRHAVSVWMDVWYAEDPDRQAAWNLWKEDNGDVGRQDNPEKVPLGIGDGYLRRVKNGPRGGMSILARVVFTLLLFGAIALGISYLLSQ